MKNFPLTYSQYTHLPPSEKFLSQRQEFNALVHSIEPALKIRSRDQFMDFTFSDGAEDSHDLIMLSLPQLTPEKELKFSSAIESILDPICVAHRDDLDARSVKSYNMGRNGLTPNDWRALKGSLASALKEAATHIALVYQDISDKVEPPVLLLTHYKPS